MQTLTWKMRRQMKRELKLYDGKVDLENAKAFYTDPEYIACVADILEHPVFLSMDNYIQHGTTTCKSHCIDVSYFAYNVAKAFDLDARACARAGLLHDLFLYDWHDYTKRTGNHFHGFTHPRIALNNATKHFHLNKMEKDIILKHMWPLTIIPPRYKEGFVICYADKYCCTAEVFKRMSLKMRRAISA